MSMLKKLKETQKNPVFLEEKDDDMDIDNMDFPLPSDSSPGMPNMANLQKMMQGMPAGMPNMGELQKMMQGMSSGMPDMGELQKMMQGMSAGSRAPEPKKEHISVATGPQGVRRLSPEEYKDWVTVYPCYIDVDKSVQDGRKISKATAVKEPHAYHMAVAVQRLNLTVVYENKRHPRDWANVGRVRVQLKSKDNRYYNPKLTSRKKLFAAVAELMPIVQKESSVPNTYASPLITLEEVDEQRKAQGLPALSDMQFNNPMGGPGGPQVPPQNKSKKQKIKYVRA